MAMKGKNLLSLNIPIPLWRSLIKSLRQRGRGIHESGAFLLGQDGTNKITTFVLYDDLDPHCLDEGIVIFKGYGFTPLWKLCEEKRIRVMADIHTHGNMRVFQSEADKDHPMISKNGHIALILPNFAQNHFLNLKGMGIYEYRGDNQWQSWGLKSGRVKWTLV